MAAHAKNFGASNAHRWRHCAAAPIRERGLPNTSSEYAREGTAAHFLAAHVLTNGGQATDYIGARIGLPSETFLADDATDEFVIVVEEEMANAVKFYTDYINNLVATSGGELFVETRVDYRQWLPDGIDEDDGFGTADAIIVAADTIYVADLKMGQGEKVDAKDNEQLRLYALGAYAEHSVFNDFKFVSVAIVQPRKGGDSDWTYPLDEVLEFGEDTKRRAQVIVDADALGIEPTACPGDKTCRWCKAKSTCPELQALVLQTVFDDFDTMETKVPPVASLVECWKRLDIIEGWARAIKERMYEETLAGSLPEYKIVEGRKGNRAWADAEVAETTLKAMRLKQDQMYKFTLQGPATIEKLLKDKPRSWKKVIPLITQPGGKLTVAHVSDPRQAVAKPADDFDDIGDLF